ncbi:MAG: transketolase family protein [Candidatus Methylomirabilia bacterium]
MRAAFVETLTQVAAENPRVILLTADLGFQIFDEFQARFGRRYVNVGVAEAQLVCAAAGLALEGWRPVTYSIASFHVSRPYEQLRISVSYPQLPVVVVGVGGGYGYAHNGVTHHAVNDFALMCSMPGMAVVAPGDANEVAQLLPQTLQLPGPCYVRIGRGNEPSVPAPTPAILGHARLLTDGERVAVLSTGDMASVVLEALAHLQSERIFPLAYQMHTIRPLDTATLDELAAKVHTILTIEEHSPDGGLTAAVSAWLLTRARTLRLMRLGPPGDFALGNLHPHDLRHRLNYDAESIAEACRSAWKAPS